MEDSLDNEIYRLPPLGEGPWLITTHENQKANKLEKQLLLMSNKSCTRTIPELHRNVIESAHQGWFILRTRYIGSYYSLWNPVTSKLIRLPELLAPELEHDYIEPSACVLTCSPDDAETCVLVLFFEEGLVFSCRPTVTRDCSWVKQIIEVEGEGVTVRMAVVIEGVIYTYINNQTFLSMTVANDCSNLITYEPLTLQPPDIKINFPLHSCISYMVESRGALYFIYFVINPHEDRIDRDFIKVLVWRLDFSKMEWVRVECLGNRAFLLGIRCSTWCWADPDVFIDENSIYLAQSKTMFKYNLQDDSYSSLLVHPKFLKPFYIPSPTWFVPPSHQRLSPECEEKQVMNERRKRPENTEQELQEVPTGTLVPELPIDIFRSISKHMNMFDYMNLRATCKQIQKACPLAQWRANCSYPLLMVLNDSRGTYELIDPYENISRTISNVVHSSPTISSTIEFCKDGWLLVLYHRDRLKYLNPFTRVTYEYPLKEYIVDVAGFGFSTCPTSSDCVTVGMLRLENQVLIVCFNASNKEWEYYQYNRDKDVAFIPNYKTSSRYYKNAFYFLGMNGNLGVFEINEGDIRCWHVYKSPFSEEIELNSSYLVELNGELITVFIGEVGIWVRVFKFDTSDKRWLELFSLEDHVLFISHASCFSVLAKKREMKNRIYLPKRMDNDIVFYSLDTRKYHTSAGGDSTENFHGMKQNLNCCWI